MDLEMINQINRLIYLSLAYSNGSKRIVTENQNEAVELVQKFQADDLFQQGVLEGLKAMEIQFLDIDTKGLRLSSRQAGSFFASTLTDYGKMLARNEMKTADLLCVHCAIATVFFPTEVDLDAPVEDLGVVMVEDVMDILKRFAYAEKNLDAKDELIHPNVRTAARRFLEIPEENPDSRRAGSGNSWLELINRVLEHMVSTGYILAFEEHPGELEFRPTPSYQVAMKHAAVNAFHSFRDAVSSFGETPFETTDNEAL